MKTANKVLFITSLSCLALSCLMLILAIFGVKIFEGIPLRLLLISSTFALGCGIAMSELNVAKKRRVLGFVSLGFLSLSVLLALISFCTPLFEVEIFNRITGVVALLSVLMAIIVSLNTKLDKKLLPLQIVTYALLSIVTLFIILLVCGVQLFSVDGLAQVFGVLCVLAVGLLIATIVVSAKKQGDEKVKGKDVKTEISLAKENEMLKLENAQLKAEVEDLKNQLASLQSK